MKKFHKILMSGILLALCISASLLLAAAESAAPSASYTFPAGTTVEQMKAELASQSGMTLVVIKPDGSVRGTGLIHTGDTIEIFDAQDNLNVCLTAVVEGDSPSSAVSSEISSEGTSSQEASSEAASSGKTPVSSAPGSSSPVISGEPSSEPESHPASSSQSGSSAAASSLSAPQKSGYQRFESPTTVAALKKQLNAYYGTGNFTLAVMALAGVQRQSGRICTGDTIRIYGSDGILQSETCAVVAGDLARRGGPTAAGREALYDYLTETVGLDSGLLQAADMNRDGTVDTCDLLLLKKALSVS